MSRSYRKTAKIGVATGASEKTDKRLYNRRFRRITKKEISQGREIFTILKEICDPWDMTKDGKIRFNQIKYPELLRK